jgi:hypothetical protein
VGCFLDSDDELEPDEEGRLDTDERSALVELTNRKLSPMWINADRTELFNLTEQEFDKDLNSLSRALYKNDQRPFIRFTKGCPRAYVIPCISPEPTHLAGVELFKTQQALTDHCLIHADQGVRCVERHCHFPYWADSPSHLTTSKLNPH